MMRFARALATTLSVLALALPASGGAQGTDPSTRLRSVLPAAVAERVLGRIAEARAQGLPAAALEQRALRFAARGVAPADIERSVNEHAARLRASKDLLDRARGRRSAEEEVEAGAEVLRLGVTGASVAELAQSAPSGRSLAVPLYVIGSLVSRGIAADDAIASVRTRLLGRASDAEIEQLTTTEPGRSGERGSRPTAAETERGRPDQPGVGGASTNRGGPPAGVPRNAGKKATTDKPGKGVGRKP